METKMELQTLIHKELWEEISISYESGNYKNAILDTMRYLSKVIRDKSGLDGDGVSLIGQTFGGDEPVLKINKLQTNSERDEQKGFQQILIGLYQGIRNPRTHSDKTDNPETANAIIYFVDFVLGVLDTAKAPFALEDFLSRVFDPDFVQREDYAKEIVKDIPAEKRLETLIEIFRRKNEGDGDKLFYSVREILVCLSPPEQEQFATVVSDEFEKVSENKSITTALNMLPNDFWGTTRRTATLRIENKLIQSIKLGRVDIKTDSVNREGALGTWARDLIPHMLLRDEFIEAIRKKIWSSDVEENYYVLKFFMYQLPDIFSGQLNRRKCITASHNVVGQNNKNMEKKLFDFLFTCPKEWKDEIVEAFKDFTDPDTPLYYTPNGEPFLGNVPPPVDDIPF